MWHLVFAVLVVVQLTGCVPERNDAQDTRDDTRTSHLQPHTNGGAFRCVGGACSSVPVMHRELSEDDAKPNTHDDKSLRDDRRLGSFLSEVSDLAPGAEYDAWFELESVGPGIDEYRELRTASGRQSFAQERGRAQVAAQAEVRNVLRQRGGRVVYHHWLTNGFVARATPDTLSELALHPDVISASLNTVGENNSYSGLEFVDYPQLGHLVHDHNFEGSSGGRAGANIQVAMTDYENINCAHVGWEDWAGGPSRLDARRCAYNFSVFSYTCGFTSGVCDLNEPRFHGTTTTWEIAGSIEQGQDSAFPGSFTAAQNVRSGILHEADVHYMEVTGGCALKAATNRAVSIGADVLVMPLEVFDSQGDSVLCSTTFDSCGLNSAIRDAHNAGVIVVVGPGNNATTSCYVEYPGTRSEVLAVGGLDTNEAGGNIPYRDSLQDSTSPQGSTSTGVSIHGGGSASVDWISLMAPQDVNYRFGSGGTASYDTSNQSGTSFAAPIIGGLAGATREFMSSYAFSNWDQAGAVMANTFLHGDGYSGSFTPTGNFNYTVGERSGYGRALAVYPGDLGPDSEWESVSDTAFHGLTDAFAVNGGSPIPTSVNGIKIALFYTDADYQNVPDIQLQLVDTCPSGGGEVVVQSTFEHLRERIRLEGPDIHGRCLEVRVRGLSVPVPYGRDYHLAYYFFSNSDYRHGDDW